MYKHRASRLIQMWFASRSFGMGYGRTIPTKWRGIWSSRLCSSGSSRKNEKRAMDNQIAAIDNRAGQGKPRSIRLQPEYTLPAGERLKACWLAGIEIANRSQEEWDRLCRGNYYDP